MTSPAELDLWTVLLAGNGAGVGQVGSKAATLDRLIGAGVPVPRSGAVTTAAYRSFLAGSDLPSLLEELRTEQLPLPAEQEAARRRVNVAFLDAPMSDALATSIRDLATDLGRGRPLAVRSSATAEDLQTASFAGQYHTVLGATIDDIVTAVRLCWASLWHPTPRAYRRFRAIDEVDLAMAVLVMPMLEPSHAGVLFTEAPGNPELIRIEVVEGLGESLVSGARTPEVLVVDRDEIDAFAPAPPALQDLARMSIEIEAEIGTPLDFEWAIEGGEPWFLQARPITTSGAVDPLDDGFDANGGEDTRYTTAGIGEMLPGVLPPRVWELNSWMVEEAFRELFTGLGASASGLDAPHSLIGRFHGRAALNLDLMEQVVESIPGGSAAELEHQYFGGAKRTEDAPVEVPSRGSAVIQGLRTLRARVRAFEDSEVVIQAIDRIIALEPKLTSFTDEVLLSLRRRLLHLACRTMEAEVSVAATASASYRGLELFLREHLESGEAEQALQRLTVSEDATLRGRRALAVDALATELAEHPVLAPVAAVETWDEARTLLERTPAGQEFATSFSSALRDAGSTSVFGGNTWEQAPSLAWPLVRAGPRSSAPDPAELRAETYALVQQRISSDAGWRLKRVATGQIVDVRRHFLRREADDAIAFLERRERTKAALLILGGVVWRVDHEIGRRLTAHGNLESPTDADLMTGNELAQMLRGSGPAPDVVALRRRRNVAADFEPPLPRLFTGLPTAATQSPAGADRLKGWSGSSGRYEGPARVVLTAGSAELRPGEVLIAHTTDSSWLPLFHIAGAIVVEEGGPLSHAAILARELGMPAVVNVPGIIDRVNATPGAVVMVNGTSGEVHVHDSASGEQDSTPADGVVPARHVPSVADDDPGRLNVFVTGLIGASALMSVVIGLTQAIGSVRSQQRIKRRARPRAEALATAVLRGFEPVAVGANGLQSRSYFAWFGTVVALVGALVFLVADDYLEAPSSDAALWLFAVAMMSGGTLAMFAMIAAAAAVRWPLVPTTARRISLSPIDSRFTPAHLIGPAHATVAAALLLAVFVLAWVIAEAEAGLLTVDRLVLDVIDSGGYVRRWRPDVIGNVFRLEVMVPLAAIATLATYRCRPLMFTYPLVIATGGALHLGLAHLVPRTRPDIGPKPEFFDSFPGGHVNEQTIMLGLLPLVVFVLTRRTRLRVALQIFSAAVLAVIIVDALRIADHWPSDNLAGLMIGLAMVTIAHGVARTPALHGRCDGCPVQQRLAEAE